MALGKMGWETPGVLLGRAGELDESLLVTTAALRRLAPMARLVLVVKPEEEPLATRAVEAGFDDYVIEPIDPDELMEAIGDAIETGAGEGDTAGAERPAPPEAPRHGAGESAKVSALEDQWGVTEFAFASPEATPTADLQQIMDRVVEGPIEAPRPAAAGAAPDDLGDIDLVQQLLADRKGFRDLALRLVAARSGFADVTWAAERGDSAAAPAAAAISYRGAELGWLRAAAPATGAALEPWAAWLGHWLALDRKLGELSDCAFKDGLTGVWNRRYFDRFFEQIMSRAVRERFGVTLLVFDIDDFKIYNDRYGHAAGDDILRETARLMQSVVRTHDVVARIGGDEFAVIFWDAEGPRQPNSRHPQDVLGAAQRFQRAICEHRFPKLLNEAPGTLTISGGLAGFPWDGRATQELLDLADARALESKRDGKDAIKFGPGAEQVCKYLPR
jgi:diguanylate cyclase (GGDEF)-like protein